MLNVSAAVAVSHLRGGCILWLGKVLCAPIDFADAFGHLLERPLATFPLSPVEVAVPGCLGSVGHAAAGTSCPPEHGQVVIRVAVGATRRCRKRGNAPPSSALAPLSTGWCRSGEGVARGSQACGSS